MQLWVGVADKLPRVIHATYLDDPNRLRHDVELSDWQIDVPVPADVFASLKTASPEHIDSGYPHPVGTSGVQSAERVRPLAIHTFSAKYWGTGPTPVAGVVRPTQTPMAELSGRRNTALLGITSHLTDTESTRPRITDPTHRQRLGTTERHVTTVVMTGRQRVPTSTRQIPPSISP